MSSVVLERQATELMPGRPPMLSTAPSAAASVRFIDLELGVDLPPHPAPARQFVVVLRGVIEVESTDGEVVRLTAGDVGLAADVGGHLTRVIDRPARLMFVEVPSPAAEVPLSP